MRQYKNPLNFWSVIILICSSNEISKMLKLGRRTLREPAFAIIIIFIIISIAIFVVISSWVQRFSFNDIITLDIIKCQQQLIIERIQ